MNLGGFARGQYIYMASFISYVATGCDFCISNFKFVYLVVLGCILCILSILCLGKHMFIFFKIVIDGWEY